MSVRNWRLTGGFFSYIHFRGYFGEQLNRISYARIYFGRLKCFAGTRFHANHVESIHEESRCVNEGHP